MRRRIAAAATAVLFSLAVASSDIDQAVDRATVSAPAVCTDAGSAHGV